MVVASALFVSTAVVFAASPANAAGTGSMVDNGDGSMTVTWTASAPGDSVLINFYPSTIRACDAGSDVRRLMNFNVKQLPIERLIAMTPK